MFTNRTKRVQLSPTFRVAGLARDLKERGLDVVDFSVGEPDFPTPTVVKEAGKAAIDRDVTRYTANEGTLQLRRAIAAKLRAENGLTYGPDEILVTPGAKGALFSAAMALFEDGDDVIVPAPCWTTHPEQVRLAGANPIFVHGEESRAFAITADQLASAVTPRTKGIVLNYPSNPTGATYDREELAAIAEVCVSRNLVAIADEIYEKLLYDGRTFTSIAAISDAMRSRTVLVNGMSKAFAMTGWRVGYAAAPRGIIVEMAKVQSHGQGHPAAMAQAASVVALERAADDVARMRVEFQSRRDLIVSELGKIEGWSCVSPAGAFYAFPNVASLFGREVGGRRLESSTDVAVDLLERAAVAVVPGDAFEAPSHVRISFACSRERILEGVRRIAEAYS